MAKMWNSPVIDELSIRETAKGDAECIYNGTPACPKEHPINQGQGNGYGLCKKCDLNPNKAGNDDDYVNEDGLS